MLGQIYYEDGQNEKAIEHLERYLEIDPGGIRSQDAQGLLDQLNNPSSNDDFVQIINRSAYTKNHSKNKFKQDGVKTFEIFNNHLYFGTSYYKSILKGNVGSGCEIWRLRNL